MAEAGRVEVRVQDFRAVEGSFTKVASIEMLEAIGEKLFPSFFATINCVLAPRRSRQYPDDPHPRRPLPPLPLQPGLDRASRLPRLPHPPLGALAQAAGEPPLTTPLEEIGQHYGETLARWREAFVSRLGEVRAPGYDERFVRTWTPYSALVRGASAPASSGDAQLVVTC